MSQHTPGPWRAGFSELDIVIRAEHVDGQPYLARLVNSRLPDENRANARLIAAAPDLIAICNEVLEWQRTFFKIDFEIEKRLRAAIAKAEGREP